MTRDFPGLRPAGRLARAKIESLWPRRVPWTMFSNTNCRNFLPANKLVGKWRKKKFSNGVNLGEGGEKRGWRLASLGRKRSTRWRRFPRGFPIEKIVEIGKSRKWRQIWNVKIVKNNEAVARSLNFMQWRKNTGSHTHVSRSEAIEGKYGGSAHIMERLKKKKKSQPNSTRAREQRSSRKKMM